MRTWAEVEARRGNLKLPVAEMCRRAGISDSTFWKGLKGGTRVSNKVRHQLELVLAMEAQLQADAARREAAE